MSEQIIIIAVTSLTGLCVVAAALLRGWSNWLALKQNELDRVQPAQERGSPMGAARIEIADLKERIRKLEAIASGVDL